jgi:ribonucleoside-triphosphate reductase
MQKFNLSESFVEQYKNKKVPWGPLGEFTYLRTYSRFIEELNRNEVWFETVKRVVEGTFSIQKEHCFKLRLPWKPTKAQRSAQIMYDKIFNFRFLPPGRGLWMMGTKFIEERGSASLNNCAFCSTEDLDNRGSFAFTWAMDALMLGVGVGFDANGAGKITFKQPKNGDDLIYKIPDSREGWVESVGMVIDGFILGKKIPTFDYTLIRPYGAPIKGFGGVASGPEPLTNLHKGIVKLLTDKVGESITSTDIVDIFNMIGVCVVAGNVRRSAEIAIGKYDDKEYTTMKDPKKHSKELMSHRWASNNSVFAEVGKTDYSKFVPSICSNGEPGIIWLENIRKFSRTKDDTYYVDKFAAGVNPCNEQTLESYELCCLVETFPSLHKDFEEYKETLKYAYLYAKTVTLLPTHWEETNAVMMKNRRIGTSQSGIIDAFVRHGRRTLLNWCDVGYDYLKQLDETYSNWLCIPKSIKITSVKPSGTVSLLPGVSPGIHYPHSEYYIRRVRVASNSPLVDAMKKAGYEIETSKYGSTEEEKEKTAIVSFPVHEPNFSKRKDDVTIWEQVKNAVDYQHFWADNNVSITVTFKKSEENQIQSVLEAYENTLKGISFLPISEHGYEQAPYEEINKDKFEEMSKKLKVPDFTKVITTPIGESYCSNETCTIDFSKKKG